jgi:hypothetical protein
MDIDDFFQKGLKMIKKEICLKIYLTLINIFRKKVYFIRIVNLFRENEEKITTNDSWN